MGSSPALAFCASGGPGWILDVWRTLFLELLGMGQVRMEFWAGGWVGRTVAPVPDAPSVHGPVRLQMGRASCPHHPTWASLPSGPPWGQGDLFSSQNKHHDLRKTVSHPSVSLGVRDNGIFLRRWWLGWSETM